jgi:hypothetical protein
MVTSSEPRKPRQSWVRRLWPLPVVGLKRAENPRVGGSTPSQATTYERHREHTWNTLRGAVGGPVLLIGLLSPCVAQEPADPWGPPPPPPPAETGRLQAASIDAAWIGGAAALDLGASRWALARCAGCYEANPLMRSVPVAIVAKAGATAVGVAWADHLRRKGDRRGARIVRWSFVGLQVALAGNAIVQAHR